MKIIANKKIHTDTFFEESLSLLGIASFEGNFIRMNKIFLDTIGYTWEEIQQIPFLDLVHPEDVEQTIQQFKGNKEGKRTYSFVNRYIHRNGDVIFFEWTAVPDMEEGVIYCTAKNITEQKELEKKLQDSEATFRLILDATPVGITLCNEQRELKFANQAFCDMMGYTFSELKGMDWNEITHPEDHLLNLKKYSEIYSGEARKLIIHKRYYRKDRSLFWAKVEIAKRYLPSVGKELFVTAITDISNEIQLTNKLNDLNKNLEHRVEEHTQELRRSNKDLEQFVYIASHDLKEPLRTIENYVGLIEKEKWEEIDEDVRFFLGRMRVSNRRMLNLVNDLLDYSRVGRKKELEPVNLNELLKEILQDMEGAIRQSGAIVTLAPLPVVMGVQHDLRHLFANLISNAIKFRKKDCIPEIQVNVDKREGKYHFSIQDNGIGIEEAYLDHIFSIFKRLHNSKEFEGTGIGLSLCKKIVELYGGEIWATSDYGKGSVFSFHLPVYGYQKISV